MDAVQYLAAKAKGQASIISHVTEGNETVLVSMPDGYDPATGDPKPLKEEGMQRSQFHEAHAAAVKALEDWQAQEAGLLANIAACNTVCAEVDEMVDAALAVLKAEAALVIPALTTGIGAPK